MSKIAWKARYVGLDVHAKTISIAVAESGRDKARFVGKIPNQWEALKKVLKKLGPTGSLYLCYEAGPTGYGLYRRLSREGHQCIVVAPSLIPKKPGERVKTDRRDACNLARLLRAGELTPVWVPDEETEAVRDLVRTRDAAKKAQRVARQQLSKFLLRHGRRYPGKTNWTKLHLAWITKQHFEHEAQQLVLEDYLNTVEAATRRLLELEQAIDRIQQDWSRAPLVKALQAFRGIRLVTAATVAAEIGDFRRFSTAPAFMAFLGLTPSERSTDGNGRRGHITKTGNRHVRRVLVEAAHSYRFRPRVSRALRERQQGVSPDICTISMSAQKRLHGRYYKLLNKGKTKQQTVTAVARELAGFIWDAALQIQQDATL